MRKGVYSLLASCIVASQCFTNILQGDASEPSEPLPNESNENAQLLENPRQQEIQTQPKPQPIAKPVQTPIENFTGRITKNKVRMRLQPSLDSPILRELNRGDMLIVVGDADEFYAVLPPKDTKAYIFRTFVLDNVVEGNRVNVRLEPALEAPVIAQLNSGDRVNGTVSPLNSKWLEIPPPKNTRFYVCKEYVEKIGDPSVMSRMEKRREEVNNLLNSTYLLSQQELQKPFDEINLDQVLTNFNKVIKQYSDFPEQVGRAKELLSSIQETYLQKKIDYLESRARSSDSSAGNTQLSDNNKAQQDRIKELETQLKNATEANKGTSNGNAGNPASASLIGHDDHASTLQIEWNDVFNPDLMTGKMATWIPVEKKLYDAWSKQHDNPTPEQFYQEQIADAVTLSGLLEPYSRIVRNKPGDYILVNQTNSLPIAYLYSTKVNLQEKAGQEITVRAIARPNNNFAFPAYYVVELE